MIIHYSSRLFKLSFMKPYAAIVLGRHCLTVYKEGEFPLTVLKHEMVHQSQMDRVGVIMFYLIYLKDYVKNLFKYKNHWDAYMNIPFEVEAYGKEND